MFFTGRALMVLSESSVSFPAEQNCENLGPPLLLIYAIQMGKEYRSSRISFFSTYGRNFNVNHTGIEAQELPSVLA
jgi:hypothetical protein